MLNAVLNQLCIFCWQIKSTVCCMRFIFMHMCDRDKFKPTSNFKCPTHFCNDIMRWHWCAYPEMLLRMCQMFKMCAQVTNKTERQKGTIEVSALVLDSFHYLCDVKPDTPDTPHQSQNQNQIKSYRRIQRLGINYSIRKVHNRSRMRRSHVFLVKSLFAFEFAKEKKRNCAKMHICSQKVCLLRSNHRLWFDERWWRLRGTNGERGINVSSERQSITLFTLTTAAT